ncbi:hypothetical protein [Kroppenstedtia guangzhouensis]|nr:hypothetical protein [Kroppenstedtia guangzhouensis]
MIVKEWPSHEGWGIWDEEQNRWMTNPAGDRAWWNSKEAAEEELRVIEKAKFKVGQIVQRLNEVWTIQTISGLDGQIRYYLVGSYGPLMAKENELQEISVRGKR